jgi:peptide/nickel transport system substrate-binding protein
MDLEDLGKMELDDTGNLAAGTTKNFRVRRRPLLLGALSWALVSCAPQATVSPSGSPSAASTPKRGGTLRMRATGDPVSLDTYSTKASTAIVYVGPILNNLITENPYKPGEIIPELADKWEVSADGTVVTFHIRQGVQWHDGKPFTSADALYNLNRAWKPPAPEISRNSDVFRSTAAISAPDDSTVRVTLKQPSAAFIPAMGQPFMTMYPAHIPDMNVWSANPVGTGPFVWKSFKRGQSIDYVRNEKYWKAGLPYLDGITQLIVLDNAQTYAALKLGQLDISSPMDTGALVPHLDTIQQDIPGVENYAGTGARFDLYVNKRGPFADKRVRQAIHLGFDRKAFLDVGYSKGGGTYPIASLYPTDRGGLWGIPQSELSGMPGFRENKVEDLARAKQLLQEAGVGPNTKLQYLVQLVQRDSAPAAADILNKIGFATELLIVDYAEEADRKRRGDYDVRVSTLPGYYDDPQSNLTSIVISGGSGNVANWSVPAVDELLVQQDATADVAKRKDLLRQMQLKLIDESYLISLFWTRNQMAWQRWVKNQPHWTTTLGPQWRFEATWLDR